MLLICFQNFRHECAGSTYRRQGGVYRKTDDTEGGMLMEDVQRKKAEIDKKVEK